METSRRRRDLILLVADKNIEYTVRGLLTRPKALGVRAITFDVLPHPERDPGCLLRAPEFLQSFEGKYRHALVLLDLEGSGRGTEPRAVLEEDLEARLSKAWDMRAAAVVMAPELEAWLWSDSPHVEEVLGWHGRKPGLRSWLRDQGFLTGPEPKPGRPKEAVEEALRVARKPRSSALYRQLAERVSFRRCTDPAFGKFLQVLRQWFPVRGHPSSGAPRTRS